MLGGGGGGGGEGKMILGKPTLDTVEEGSLREKGGVVVFGDGGIIA